MDVCFSTIWTQMREAKGNSHMKRSCSVDGGAFKPRSRHRSSPSIGLPDLLCGTGGDVIDEVGVVGRRARVAVTEELAALMEGEPPPPAAAGAAAKLWSSH